MRRLTIAGLALTALLVTAVPAQAANRWIQKQRAAQHRPPGRRGRVPVQHALRVPQGAARGRRHARARRRRDQGQQGDRHARHHGRRQDERHRQRLLADAQADQAPGRRLLVRARSAESHYSHEPAGVRVPLPRDRHREEEAAAAVQGAATSACRPCARSCARSRTRRSTSRSRAAPPRRTESEYIQNAEVLAKLLKKTKRRDLIVVSFLQPAVDRFHELVPRIDVAPGIAGAAVWIFGGGSPGPGRGRVPGADHVRAHRRSRPPSAWPAPTARATPGRTGSRATTATPRTAGGR